MGLFPPPGQLGGGCLHRALFTAQSEQRGGGTSERRKEQGSQRGRREGRVEEAGRKEEEEGQNRGEERPLVQTPAATNYSFIPKGTLNNSFLKSHNNA